MNILITCDRYPTQRHDGLTLRIAHYVRQLSARHRFDLLCIADPATPSNTELERHLGEVIRLAPPARTELPRSPLQRWRDAFDIRRLYRRSPQIQARIEQQCRSRRYDLIWDAGANLLLNLDQVRRQIPLLVDQVDDAVLPLRRQLAQPQPLRQRLWLHKQILLQKRFGRRYIEPAPRVLFVSPLDAESFRGFCPGARTQVIANGVDLDYFAPVAANAPDTDTPQLVFEGVMAFGPNVDAAKFLVEEIMPLIWQRAPEARLSLVGRDPLPAVLALRQQRVEVTGFVPDVRPYLDQSRIFVCPMRGGAGIKNKILQAWAMGLAVVSTPEGAYGLPARDGENMLLRSGAAAIAEAVMTLAGDAALRQRLGRAGRACVEAEFSWARKAQAFEQLCEQVAKGPP